MALPEIIKDIDARVIRPASTDNAIVRFDGTTAIDKNVAGSTTCSTDKRNFFNLFLHYPHKSAANVTVNRKNIVNALMIGHKNVRFLFVVQVASHNAYAHKRQPTQQTRPHNGRVVAPLGTFAKWRYKNCCDGCQNGDNQADRDEYTKLVNHIQRIKYSCNHILCN